MKTTLFSLLLFITGFFASPAFAIDQVTLNSGQVLEGTVLNDVTNLYVDIRLINGESKRIQHSDVKNVERDVPSRKDTQQYANQSTGFIAPMVGGIYNFNGSQKQVDFDWGVKVGVIPGMIGDNKFAMALSYDRSSRSNGLYGLAYNDLNVQFLLMRIANSGFYFGPNVGLAILVSSVDDGFGTTTSDTNTQFEAGVTIGYEVLLSDSFAIGPEVRYEHIFGDIYGNDIKFNLAATLHF